MDLYVASRREHVERAHSRGNADNQSCYAATAHSPLLCAGPKRHKHPGPAETLGEDKRDSGTPLAVSRRPVPLHRVQEVPGPELFLYGEHAQSAGLLNDHRLVRRARVEEKELSRGGHERVDPRGERPLQVIANWPRETVRDLNLA